VKVNTQTKPPRSFLEGLRVLIPWAILGLLGWWLFQSQLSVEAKVKVAVQQFQNKSHPFVFGRFWAGGPFVCLEARTKDGEEEIFRLTDHDEPGWVVKSKFATFEACVRDSRG
jgi:hypothetical protein